MPRSRSPLRSQAKVILFLLVLLGPMLFLGSTGGAKATGVPIQEGGYLTNDHHYLVFNGISTWGGQYQVITPDSQVYAADIIVVIYSLVQTTTTITITLDEKGQTFPQTSTVSPGSPSEITVSLLPDNSWTGITLWVDNTPRNYSVAVPISFLPNNIANIGGLDLITLVVLSESLIALALALTLAYSIMRKALWAPKFSLLVWGHVILIGIATAVLLDFQTVDSVFAGWSPLVYVAFLFPLFLLFGLSFFNHAPAAEMLQANAPLAGRLSFNRWDLRIGKDGKGRWVYIDERWRGLVARAFGHHIPLTTTEASITGPEPFVADLVARKVVAKDEVLRRIRKPSPEKSSPLDDFDIVPSAFGGKPSLRHGEPPAKLLFTPVGKPVEVERPKLTIYREKLIPPKLDKDSGEVIIPEHYAKRLTWPHYTEGRAKIELHALHFRSAISVVNNWRTADDLAVVLSDTTLDFEALKATFHTQKNKLVRERLLARESLLGRGDTDLSVEEATLEAERDKSSSVVTSLDSQFGRGMLADSLKAKRPTSGKG